MFRKNSGKIKIRLFAIVLLGISISGMISSYRSISREFSGIIVNKKSDTGFLSERFWLYIIPQDKSENIPHDMNLLLEKQTPGLRVGVSGVLYQSARISYKVFKKRFSPFVFLNSERHIDLGIVWILLSMAAAIISFVMYYQTVIPCKNGKMMEQAEEII